MSQECIFCKIVSKEIPATVVYEDQHLLAFPDINPAAPVHVLVIPKQHITSLVDTKDSDKALLGHVMTTLPQIADALGLSDDGFRLVINTGENGGQTVNHLHCHILGGRRLNWPPG